MKQKRPHATRRILWLPNRRTAASPARTTSLFGRLAILARSGLQGVLSLGLGAIIVALIGLLVANFVGQVMQSARLEAQRSALEAEVEQIRAANRQLEAAVAYAESDVNVERIAREQLGYARDGDVVIMPQMATPPPTPTLPADRATLNPMPPAPPAPNWQRWWDAFFPAESAVM